jgi:hypothetical protein
VAGALVDDELVDRALAGDIADIGEARPLGMDREVVGSVDDIEARSSMRLGVAVIFMVMKTPSCGERTTSSRLAAVNYLLGNASPRRSYAAVGPPFAPQT